METSTAWVRGFFRCWWFGGAARGRSGCARLLGCDSWSPVVAVCRMGCAPDAYRSPSAGASVEQEQSHRGGPSAGDGISIHPRGEPALAGTRRPARAGWATDSTQTSCAAICRDPTRSPLRSLRFGAAMGIGSTSHFSALRRSRAQTNTRGPSQPSVCCAGASASGSGTFTAVAAATSRPGN